MIRLLPWLIAAIAGLSLLTGCTFIGLAVGSAIDTPESTYSIKNSPTIEKYMGRTVTVIDSNLFRYEATLDSIAKSRDSVAAYFYLSQRFSDHDIGRVLRYSKDEILEILVTDPRTYICNTLTAFGMMIDIGVLFLFGRAMSAH